MPATTTTTTVETARSDSEARDYANAVLLNILEEVAALRKAEDEGEAEYQGETLDADTIRERIAESVLSVEVRGGWHTPGGEDDPEEYRILLGTGGPASQIVGELDGYGQPNSASVQGQQWFTPWVDADMSNEEETAVLEYVSCFYLGE